MVSGPASLAYQKAHIGDDKRANIIAGNVVGILVAYIAVYLRFLSRRLARTPVKGDDILILGSLVSPSSFPAWKKINHSSRLCPRLTASLCHWTRITT